MALHGRAPDDVKEMVLVMNQGNPSDLQVPLSWFFNRAEQELLKILQVDPLRLLNGLLVDQRGVHNLDAFNKDLKTHLFDWF